MKKDAKKIKRPRSIRAITARIILFTFILWAGVMFSITIIVAQFHYNSFFQQQLQFLNNASRNFFEVYNDEAALAQMKSDPVNMYMLMHRTIRENSWVWSHPMPPLPWHGNGFIGRTASGIFRSEPYRLQSAIIFTDADGNILMDSGDIKVTIFPIPQEVWATLQVSGDEHNASFGAFGVQLNLDMLERMYGLSLPKWHLGSHGSLFNVHAIRITGFSDRDFIYPVKLCYITNESWLRASDSAFDSAREGGMFSEYLETSLRMGEDGEAFFEMFLFPSVNALYNAGFVEWSALFDNTSEIENTDGLVTIYGFGPLSDFQNPGRPIIAGSNRYDDLLSFLRQAICNEYSLSPLFPLDGEDFRLNNIVIAQSQPFRDFTGYDLLPLSYDDFPKPDFIMHAATHSNPLSRAINELVPFYTRTLLITALMAALLIRMIKRNLTIPLKTVNEGIAADWARIAYSGDKPPKWHESFELFEHYERTKEELLSNKKEITRLTTALNYAKSSEQKRRQMTSNIAHELKTPLAIIHSYSEGLKERIAEEKREQYLDVILAESENMDSMVLEMLDLSRLEAGKVKLALDEFSLTELTQSIFDKLGIAISEKELKLSCDIDGNYTLTADEARIGQVISNFATNAIKYTPHGGNVCVKIYSNNNDKTCFSVVNDCAPLSRKELSEIWESFYQADNARTGSGAGLGLAIAKSIIELHGGTCFVRNTKTGVEFGFTI